MVAAAHRRVVGNFKITNCYDSHTHFWATGQVHEGLKLNDLTSAEAIRKIEIKKSHYRSNWLVGFGWNQNNWNDPRFPNKDILDVAFPDTPVFFSRVDGHASWLNSAAISELRKSGYDFSKDPEGGIIERNMQGEPTGILLDQAHINALLKLPDFSEQQDQSFFKSAQEIFNRSGFTHVRDMSMTLKSWKILRAMEEKRNLTVCLDAFITAENLHDLDRVLGEIEAIKKDPSKQMRLHGVKIFVDGSLGSKTALLTRNYINTLSNGLQIWSLADMKELIRRAWLAGQQVAIHTIGDRAVHTAVVAAREISAQGIAGRLHLEHVELLRPETIPLMKPLHVVCHLQPCHWLSDHTWLKQAIPAELVKNLFPWEILRKNKIPFYFGSDSPIEPPSLFNNKAALDQSIKWGVPELNADWLTYHTHPDANWMNCHTEIENGRIKQVFFNNSPLF